MDCTYCAGVLWYDYRVGLGTYKFTKFKYNTDNQEKYKGS